MDYKNFPQIIRAEGQDPIKIDGAWYSTDLSFIATCILSDRGVTIREVLFHPQRTDGTKVYYLTPPQVVEQIHNEYISDNLLIPPQRLSQKIASIRTMTAKPFQASVFLKSKNPA